ncbi:MAG: DegT/DnrJ/EryC1/StrS family aminotransferase, partial [Flavobacteriales bacterium]|nr:DegT/DnrJ/EryC1/StrS family aminotransferase [Flavobacteriales bacterium]
MSNKNVFFFPNKLPSSHEQFIRQAVFNSGINNKFILNDNVEQLEKRICQKTGAAAAIAVHSGTGAISVALRGLGVKQGDEVITQGFCCQPVASEIINLGAKPVFTDIDSDTMVMDANLIESRITKKTKAILPAHLFSNMVDMKHVNSIAKKYSLKVLEDACVQQG